MKITLLLSAFFIGKNGVGKAIFRSSSFFKAQLSVIILLLAAGLAYPAKALPVITPPRMLPGGVYSCKSSPSDKLPISRKVPLGPIKPGLPHFNIVNAAGFAGRDKKAGQFEIPSFSYTTPNTYMTGQPITPLTPKGQRARVPAYSTTIDSVKKGSLAILSSGLTQGPTTDAFGNRYVITATGDINKTSPDGKSINITNGLNLSNLVVDPSGNCYGLNTAGEFEFLTSLLKISPDGKSTSLYWVHHNITNFAMDFSGNIIASWEDFEYSDEGEYEFNGSGLSLFRPDSTTQLLKNGLNFTTKVMLDTAGTGKVYFIADSTLYRMNPVSGYYLNSMLPAGLNFNGATGTISGTPSRDKEAANYIVTGYNQEGSSQATVNIKVLSNQLASLEVASSKLRPGFSPLITNYQMPVSTSTITVTAKTNDPLATLKINGVITASGTSSANIALNPGDNTVSVMVTPQNGGAAQTYIINVQRLSPPLLSYPGPQGYVAYKPVKPLLPAAMGVGAYGYTGASTVLATGLSVNKIVSDGLSNVYVTNTLDGTIKKIPVGGGPPVNIVSGFSHINGIAIDASGNIFVSDSVSNMVARIPAGGGPAVSIGSGFINPGGISVDRHGNVYVCNHNGYSYVNKISAATGATQIIYTSYDQIMDICTDIYDNLYYAFPGIVYKFRVGWKYPDYIVGTGFPSSMFSCNGISSDDWGNVYVSLNSNTGLPISLLWKSVPGSMKVQEIILDQNNINDVSVSNSGQLYITDASQGTIKSLIPDGGFFIREHLPEGLVFDNITGTISGTPTVLTAPANYTVTAYNAVGSATAAVNLSVIQPDSAGLNSVTISSGTLNPVFVQSQQKYAVPVPNGTTAVTLVPFSSVNGATITINGLAVSSGSPSQAIALNTGSNKITINVTSPSGTQNKTYTVSVVRAAAVAANANLFNITLSNASLTPSFSATNPNYTASVGSEVSFITMVPTTSSALATVTVNGITVNSGSASGNLPLQPGSNLIKARVTAQDGTIKTYKITVTRGTPSEAGLSSLVLSTDTLSPVFASGTTAYTAAVGNAISSIKVTPSAIQPRSIIKVNGVTIPSGTASASIPLSIGENGIGINVTSPDGSTTKGYSLVVTRTGSSEALLWALVISNSTLSPAFSPTINTYSVQLPNAVSQLRVTPTSSRADAEINVNGAAIVSGTPSAYIPLTAGNNPIQILVTAADGITQNTYNINVNRSPSNNANLADLSISSGTLSPVFSPGIAVYADTVGVSIKTVKVTPKVSEAHATVAVNGITLPSGTASGAITIPADETTPVTIKVTAQDGSTVRTYRINVSRPPASNNANLASLSISPGTLIQPFSPSTTSYNATLGSIDTYITVRATTEHPNGSIIINGGEETTGTGSASVKLNGGTNVITTRVIAEDNRTTKTYKITISKPVEPFNIGNKTAIAYVSTESHVPENDNILVRQALSPNGDGLNDRLQIDGIESHPDNKLTIIDRNGILVYEMTGYDNDARVFDGHSSKTRKLQPPGTYYYVLDYKAGDETKHKTGYLIIKY